MSRNFDLMQEMEKDRAPEYNRTVEPAFSISSETINVNDHRSLSSDAALELVQKIFLLQTQARPHLVVFAGIDHGNGCSEVAVSVAQALAGNACGGVCLVEANFRSPGLPAFFNTTNHYGLTDALLQEAPIRSMMKPICNGRLWLLSSGSLATDSPVLLTSERLKARFSELRQEFEFVIVDAPPMTLYADAIALGKLSDGVVLVVEADSTRREAALNAVGTLRSSQIEVLGAVLNKRTFPIPEPIYSRL
jgi:Mrp family chromosome partitioning ATPase